MTREKAFNFLMNISYALGDMSIEYLTEKDGEKMREAIKVIMPEPKKGRWIKHEIDYQSTGHSIYYDCSLCGCAAPCTETADEILWKLANYCPDCGANMKNGRNWA